MALKILRRNVPRNDTNPAFPADFGLIETEIGFEPGAVSHFGDYRKLWPEIAREPEIPRKSCAETSGWQCDRTPGLTGRPVPVIVPAMIDVLQAIQADIARVVDYCRYRGVDVGTIQGVITDRAVVEIRLTQIGVGHYVWGPPFCGSIAGVRFTVVADERIGWLLKVA